MVKKDAVLIIGEVIVDFTLARFGANCKLRLGGIGHAARGLWAAGVNYAVAAFCPQYLVEEAKRYLTQCDCVEFIWLGDIVGAPNVMVIGDATEIAHQGYEDLMRDTKVATFREPYPRLDAYESIVVFPGRYDISALAGMLSDSATLSIDLAYDIADFSLLSPFRGRVKAIVISTSSSLFAKFGKNDINALLREVRSLEPEVFLLKENRGGSRLFDFRSGQASEIPATLGQTVNSVGVGDVYTAVMIGLSGKGWLEAAWRGCQVATEYSQTTFPDDLKQNVQRGFKLSLEELQALGGTVLPWHGRRDYSIYLAGPDFSYVSKPEIYAALQSLEYHNFRVRRPVQENGELTRPASAPELLRTYYMDCELLKECDAVFAVPLGRDSGTLVEVGMAIALGKPVITFDPRKENENTMVMAGSSTYSADLDACLNGTYIALAKLRAEAS